MMTEELKLIPDSVNSPVKNGLATFMAFGIAGMFPLLPYLFGLSGSFNISIIFTALALFVVGSLRTLITKRPWFIAGTEMLLVGAIAATVAYFTGRFIEARL
jgi:VIT1/CCC1 family predicted Fe2+/Mn2+ transporter